MRHCGKI